ncbi:MAG: translation elongation factor-like protein [Candidatus Saganbacteria bacterium]|nr:translation elongation factor-like protein [Candidatus Saganbacteria bacterium]
MVLKKKAKKTASRKASKPKEKVIGSAEHYFDKLHVVTTTLKRPLKVGDIIHIKGHTTDMVQTVESIQIEHSRVLKAKRATESG